MESHHLFLLSWIVMISSLTTVMFIKGKKALRIFPSKESKTILFIENRVSGYSRKSFITQYGGARNILEVIITPDEFWIRSPLLFAGFGQMFDLNHKVKLSQIRNVEWNKKQVTISFYTTQKTSKTLVLTLKNAREFVDLLGKNNSK